MNKFLIALLLIGFTIACAEKSKDEKSAEPKKEETIDDGKGIGQTTHVELNDPLNDEMVQLGKSLYELKCAACHKLSDQRVVGPGWAGITDKRKPEWIMNMTTDVEAMLEKDPVARELLKECLVRMPNQNLTVEDARNVLEFMYFNDGKNLPAN